MAKKCKHCKKSFTPIRSTLEKYCKKSECVKEWIRVENEKKWKKEKKELKEKLKTKSDYEKELEYIFNAFIRERDKHLGCISCESKAGTYKITAGHFYSAGSYKNIRFNEDNVHGQCWFNCNKNRHGNLHEYRIRLQQRMGEKKLKELDRLAQIPRHYTIPELILMKLEYKEKIRKLKGD